MKNYLKNLNKFKLVSVLTSLLYFYLFIILLLFPQSFCKDVGIPGNESVYFLARRASALMLGFSALLFLVRNTPPSIVREAIAFSIGLNMAGFAILGTFEFARGFVGAPILNAVAIEVIISVSYFSFFIFDRRLLKAAK